MTASVVGNQIASPEDERNLRGLVGRNDERSGDEVRFRVHDQVDVAGVQAEE